MPFGLERPERDRPTLGEEASGGNPFAELVGIVRQGGREAVGAAQAWLARNPRAREALVRIMTESPLAMAPGRAGVRPPVMRGPVPNYPGSPGNFVPTPFTRAPRTSDSILGSFSPGFDTPSPGAVFSPRELQRFANARETASLVPPATEVPPIAPPGPARREVPDMMGRVLPFRRPVNDNTPGAQQPRVEAGPPDTSRSHVGQLARLNDAQMDIYRRARDAGLSPGLALRLAQGNPGT